MFMQIKIDFKIFAIIIIFLFTRNIGIYAILMLFALIHEIGHLVCGILLGFKPQSISIIPFGFKLGFKVKCDDYNIKIKKGNKLTLKKILIAFAGPFTNLICIVLLSFFKNHITWYQNAIYANILLILFNLIPIYPLDGSKILNIIINKIFNYKLSNILLIILSMINIILMP